MFLKQFIIATSLILSVSSVSILEEEKKIIDELLRTYDGNVRPIPLNSTTENGPTDVTINLYVRSLYNVDIKDHSFETSLTFRMQWMDPRLKFDSTRGITYLSLPPPFIKKLWKPDIFFSNERELRIHDGLAPNEYIRVFPNGEVLHSIRVSMKLSCPMAFTNFPFDQNTCSIRLASYGYTTKDIVFKWKKIDPVQVTSSLHLAGQSLDHFVTDYCDSITNTGTYSCLRVDFRLDREAGPMIRTVYIPMALSIIIVWLSMWLPSGESSLIRVITVGAALFYSQWLSMEAPTPEGISYTTAFDCWTTWCNAFLIAAIIELVIVIRLDGKNGGCMDQVAGGHSVYSKFWGNKSRGEKVDTVMRLLFPVAFFLYLVFYYVCVNHSMEDD